MKCKIGGQAVDLEIEGRVTGGVSVSRKSDERGSPRVPLGKPHRVASPKGCDTASHAPDDGRTDHTRLRSNVGGGALKHGVGSRQSLVQPDNPAPSPPFSFTLMGQIRGGKNNMKVGRDGRHYPDKTFAKWRDEAVIALYQQRAKLMPFVSQMHDILFKKPTTLEIEVHCAAGDLRRRDIPGMLDALFHVLERAQVVEDDAQIQESHWYQLPVNREHPSVQVTVKERMG